jgi:hypothetical protein
MRGLFLLCLSAPWFGLAAVASDEGGGIALSTKNSDIQNNNSNKGPQNWIHSCQALGFDPWTLHCHTCDLLPWEAWQAPCRTCCQSYKDVERITKPYEAAVLAVSEHDRNTEMDDFLRDDWDTLVESKGRENLVRVTKGQEATRHFFYFTLSPSVLFFFDQPLPKGGISYDQAQKKAKETIYLDGWKRDDIRDMLTALLP